MNYVVRVDGTSVLISHWDSLRQQKLSISTSSAEARRGKETGRKQECEHKGRWWGLGGGFGSHTAPGMDLRGSLCYPQSREGGPAP